MKRALLALLLLAAPSLANAQTNLRVWHAYRGQEREALEQAAAVWGEREGVDVDLVALPFGAFDSKLETAVPRGNGPDVFLAGHASLGKWTGMGLIDPAGADLSGPGQLRILRQEGESEKEQSQHVKDMLALWKEQDAQPFPDYSAQEIAGMCNSLEYGKS